MKDDGDNGDDDDDDDNDSDNDNDGVNLQTDRKFQMVRSSMGIVALAIPTEKELFSFRFNAVSNAGRRYTSGNILLIDRSMGVRSCHAFDEETNSFDSSIVPTHTPV